MTVVFIGHHAPRSRALAEASSAAGNQVQREIFEELERQLQQETCAAIAMTPIPAWPRGALFSRGESERLVRFPWFPNLPLLKHAGFALRTLWELLRRRPRLCIQYNAYVFENLALLAYRQLTAGARLAIVVQDVHASGAAAPLGRDGVRALTERLSLRLARRFDLIVPVSDDIVRDFALPPARCHLFQGGATRFARELASVPEDGPLEDIAVMAGALEAHNGVDVLLRRWLDADLRAVLHVFGRGSLAESVAEAAASSDRIVFHGLQPEGVVLDWQRRSRWNFCLRYDVGLHTRYFFPSKLFNILCAPGVPVANDFHGMSDEMRSHLCLLPDDLSELPERLAAAKRAWAPERVRERRSFVLARHSWAACVEEILSRLGPPKHA